MNKTLSFILVFILIGCDLSILGNDIDKPSKQDYDQCDQVNNQCGEDGCYFDENCICSCE